MEEAGLTYQPTSAFVDYPPTPQMFVCDNCLLVGEAKYYYDKDGNPLDVVAATQNAWSQDWTGHSYTDEDKDRVVYICYCPRCKDKH